MMSEITLEARVQRAREAYAAFQRRDDAALARLFATTTGWHEPIAARGLDGTAHGTLPMPVAMERSSAE